LLQINFEKETEKNVKIADPQNIVPYEHKPFHSTLIKLVEELVVWCGVVGSGVGDILSEWTSAFGLICGTPLI